MAFPNMKIHVEVPAFILFFTMMFEQSITTNLIVYRTCYVLLGFNKSECALLGTNFVNNETAALEEKVEPHALVILMTNSLTGAFLPPLISFFLGPWSDKYGRKPVLITSCLCFTLYFMLMIVFSVIPNASPWFSLLALIPFSLSGGFPTLFTVILSYISDVTSDENLGLRMGIFEAVLTGGSIIGTLSCFFVFSAYGYPAIYLICVLAMLVTIMYIAVFIPESVISHETGKEKIKKLFDITLVKDTFYAMFRKRENYGRLLLLSVTSLLTVYVLASLSDGGIIFLFLRRTFHWDLKTYTTYSSISSVVHIIGSIAGAYLLNKLLHIQEVYVIMLGLMSSMCGSLFLGFAKTNWEIYAAGSSKILNGAVGPMARALLSKVIPSEETGKVFSVVTALETTGALAGSPLYTLIYNSTIDAFPQTFTFVTAAIFFMEILLSIAILQVIKKRQCNEVENETSDISTLAEDF